VISDLPYSGLSRAAIATELMNGFAEREVLGNRSLFLVSSATRARFELAEISSTSGMGIAGTSPKVRRSSCAAFLTQQLLLVFVGSRVTSGCRHVVSKWHGENIRVVKNARKTKC
jgi:hypothetical protein